MKILITGGAGYIGSVLTSTLLNDHEVYVYDNLMYRQTSLINLCCNENFKFIFGDVRDTQKLLPFIQKADVIIPLAAIVGAPACDRDKPLATQIIYEQIVFIIKNISSHQFIICPNTNSGYGINDNGICTEESPLNPISHYGIEKVKAERKILESNSGVSLRLATVFGISPRMRLDLLVNDFTYKAMNDGYIVLFEKDFKRNFIHIKDVVAAFMLMMEKKEEVRGQVFNVGLSEANLSKYELCQIIKKHVPKFSIQFDEFTKDPDQRNYIVSNSKLENLGWKPKFGLDRGIKELTKAYQFIIHSNRKYTNL